jgi:SAM-dependent methyltransferase
MNPYESKRYLNEYLLFHYGKPEDLSPFGILPSELFRFHERIREECVLPFRRSRKGTGRVSALDIGCAVGRFTLELASVADRVVGIDNATSLIRAARAIATKGSAAIQIQESGDKFRRLRVHLAKGIRSGRVRFHVGDAQELRSFAQEGFDVVAAINLLCRLPRPSAFLKQVTRVVKPGGQFVIASPFSWLPEYTPKREWLDSSEVKRQLAPAFRLAQTRNLPFVIREHRRKYQIVVSQVMTFLRKG